MRSEVGELKQSIANVLDYIGDFLLNFICPVYCKNSFFGKSDLEIRTDVDYCKNSRTVQQKISESIPVISLHNFVQPTHLAKYMYPLQNIHCKISIVKYVTVELGKISTSDNNDSCAN